MIAWRRQHFHDQAIKIPSKVITTGVPHPRLVIARQCFGFSRRPPTLVLPEPSPPGGSRRSVRYHLTRPQAWTMRQIAEHLSTQPVAYNHRSPGEQRATLLAEGLPPLVADLLVGLD